MSVGFPAWWPSEVRSKVHALKIEDVSIARFTGLMSWVTPVDWIPNDEETQQVIFQPGEAYLRIFRTGGEVDLENQRIIHRVQFAAMSESRSVSGDIVALVQWVLYAYKDTSYVTMPDASRVPV